MKGLIIDKDYNNAENVKLIVEDMKAGFEMEILDLRDTEFTLIDTRDYDFILAAAKPALARDLRAKIKPFAKTILTQTTNYIALVKNKKIVYVDRNQIIGIEVMDKNCYIYTRKHMYEVTRITLGNLLERLEEPNILRCHKSYAVNVKYVKGFKKETRTRWRVEFIMDTDFKCSVTDMFIDDVTAAFEKYHDVKLSKFVGLW